MPLVTDAEDARDIYDDARRRGLALGCFCTENQQTTEAILRATYELSCELGQAGLPVVVGFTAGYSGRSNMSHYTSLGDTAIGTRALIDDLTALLGSRSPYRELRVMLHLDHGHPERDAPLMRKYLDLLASIMYDASELPLTENTEQTARFVAHHRERVMVEGAVDEIYEAGSGTEKDELTRPDAAERFMAETGVDLLVPNVGTEHRSTQEHVRYHGDRARAIAERVGARLCLHGTSSLTPEEVGRLPSDGFVKVNVWTVLPRTGAQAVARDTVEQLGNILDGPAIAELQQAGLLGPRYSQPDYAGKVCQGMLAPKLSHVAGERAAEVWLTAVVAKVKEVLLALGYRRWNMELGRDPGPWT